MRRTFVAVDLNEEARRAAEVYIRDLRSQFPNVRVGWERPEKLHLTLKFIGDTGERELAALEEAVSEIAVASPRFELTLAGTGTFPLRGPARILWLGVEAPPVLAEIAHRLESECRALGFEPENRKFSPHLTIGRVREPGRSGGLGEKHRSKDFGPVRMAVEEIVIYESRLQPGGSVYTNIAAARLKPAS